MPACIDAKTSISAGSFSATREATDFFGGGGYYFTQLAHYWSFLVFEKILIFILIKFYGSLCNLYLLVFFLFNMVWLKKKNIPNRQTPPHPHPENTDR